MSENLSALNAQINDWINKDGNGLSSDSIISKITKENIIDLFPSMKTYTDRNRLINQIQNDLLLLTRANEVTELNTSISKILLENVLQPFTEHYDNALREIKIIFDNQQQLRQSFRKKRDENYNIDEPITNELNLEVSMNDKSSSSIETSNSIQGAQMTTVAQVNSEAESQLNPYSVIHLLTSLLISVVKINGKTDSTIGSQIIALANQWCEQIPIIISTSISNNLALKSLKSFTSYIHELSLSEDHNLAKQAVPILLKFSIAQASFRELLPIINRLTFNKDDTYNIRQLLLKMNNCLIKILDQYEQEKSSLGNQIANESDRKEIPNTGK